MTDRKLHIESRESTPLHPWYKERLRTQFLKDPVTKQRLSGALDGGRRRFLNAGVGGFSDRLPQRFTKQQICFSKQNRLSQERRQYVEAVEHRLKTHPLALYPYLESGMTPELRMACQVENDCSFTTFTQLFDDVLSVLDPEIHVKRERSVTSSKKQEKRIEENVAPCEGLTQEPSTETKPSISTAINKPLTPIMSPITKKEVKCFSSRNPYKWKDVKETHANEKQLASVKDLYSPSQDEDLKKVTKLFCDWASSLGRETGSLTESAILNLFGNGYEKKPALTFPIQVLEPSQIPKELRTTGEYMHKDSTHSAQLDLKFKVCAPSVKTTYGAWYLDPKTWKKRPADELLRDHSVTKDLDRTEQPTEKDEELKQIHGAQAFKQFIITKGLRMPRTYLFHTAVSQFPVLGRGPGVQH
ncbi:hypothetical protein P4O66_001791 [Electrophorus voltai]|uniref:Protein FAM47E n=1 Tax=Electrophorus voltai TaxID=2609070 RepID=A0AAD8Z3X1_9TELE|nr:hypothetical protein P4O66_001791 [Electrophorus voltai]